MRNISASLLKRWSGVVLVAVLLALALPGQASAQDNVGGHFGVAFPLFTQAQGKTTTLGDKFVVAFPMGITIKPKGESASLLSDLELVPAFQPAPREVNLTIHQGILKPLRHHFVAGVVAA